jgi:hypothetical protein
MSRQPLCQAGRRPSAQLSTKAGTVHIDAHVHVLPACLLAARDHTRALIAAVAGDAMPDVLDATELLDVDVHELTWPLTLVAVGRLERLQRERFPSPIRSSTAETVEIGIASSSPISAAVIRTRRSAAIAATYSSLVRPGTRCGAEERSSSPAAPSRRYLATHFDAVRVLIPTASAACFNGICW